jgi:hypothetical protein
VSCDAILKPLQLDEVTEEVPSRSPKARLRAMSDEGVSAGAWASTDLTNAKQPVGGRILVVCSGCKAGVASPWPGSARQQDVARRTLLVCGYENRIGHLGNCVRSSTGRKEGDVLAALGRLRPEKLNYNPNTGTRIVTECESVLNRGYESAVTPS